MLLFIQGCLICFLQFYLSVFLYKRQRQKTSIGRRWQDLGQAGTEAAGTAPARVSAQAAFN